MNTVLLIGQHGQVSTYIQRVFSGHNLGDNYTLLVAGRDQLDLAKTDQIYASLERFNPSIIINPAAYTEVDKAEQESEQADLINHTAVTEIARYSERTRTPLIHFSTDYVFDGDATKPYTELNKPAPTGVYGHSKLAGETAVLHSAAPALVLRTSWVYSNHGKNFYRTMLSLAETRDELSVVVDQIGAPTYADSIARATLELVAIIDRQGGVLAEQVGVYHFSCAGQTSWYDFAKAIFAENGFSAIKVNPTSTANYPTAAKRPAFSVLDNAKLDAVFGVSLPDWQSALHECVTETQRDC